MLTKERIKALKSVGFVFLISSRWRTWDERYAKLKLYYEENGDFNVPHKDDTRLRTW